MGPPGLHPVITPGFYPAGPQGCSPVGLPNLCPPTGLPQEGSNTTRHQLQTCIGDADKQDQMLKE
jgi:hypothetical protein